jgi:hypothetical protein
MENSAGSQRKLANKESIQLLTTIAFICICLFIILVIVLHFLSTGYDPISSPTSAYAVGRYGFLMSIAFVSMSVGCFALLMGLNKGISRSAASKPGLVLFGVWVVGLWIAMIFPIAPDGTPSTTANSIHRINGPLIFLCLTISSILLSASFRRDDNWTSLYRTALGLSLVMLLIFITVLISFATGLSYEGLLQRLYLITFSIWFIVVALHLRRIS